MKNESITSNSVVYRTLEQDFDFRRLQKQGKFFEANFKGQTRMAQFTYDPASIGSGEHFMAFIVGSHPRFGSPALVSIKANLVGPPMIDLLKAEKFSGFEPKAASAFEKARDLAVQNNTDHILIVDPFGLASTQARLWTA